MQDCTIDKLGFSNRTFNCLQKSDISLLSQLMLLTEEDLKHIKNMGAKSVSEVLEFQAKIRTDQKNVGPILMIHRAIPQLIGKEVENLSYKDRNGVIQKDICIADLHFSVRTQNVLARNGIEKISEVAEAEYSSIVKFKNMGEKSINELIEYLKNNTEYSEENSRNDAEISEIYEIIKRELLAEKKDFDISLFEAVIKDNISDYKENIEKIFVTDSICRCMEQYVLSIIQGSSKIVTLSMLEEKIPKLFFESGMIHTALNSLITDKKIEQCLSGYRKYLPYVSDWLCSLKEKEQRIMEMRMSGKTLEEYGQVLDVTRERVRQIESRTVQRKPRLREDDYGYWFCTYMLDREAMNIIFEIDDKTYNYLDIVYKKCGSKPAEEMCDDDNLTAAIYANLQKYIYRDSLLIDGEYVQCRRDIICRELARRRYAEKDVSFDTFYDEYLEVLKENGKEEDARLLPASERAFEARMQDSPFILMKYGRRFRYYPINEYDINELIGELHLEQFKNVEISTLKLFNEYPELMRIFDIRDEYELHNLFKKTESVWKKDYPDLVLTRMPFMSFGEVDRAKQTEELLYQIAPVTMEEFGDFYEMEYGVLSRTAQANMTGFISQYYHKGIYQIDQPLLTECEKNFLEAYLAEDFYFIVDVKEAFAEHFDIDDLSHVNPRTLKELGYRVYTNYIVRNTYASADDYFTQAYLKDYLLDLSTWDTRIIYIQQATQSLDVLRSNYEILEYEDKKYIRYDHFAGVANMSKEDLLDYVDQAISFSGDEEFFTIQYLRGNGFESELHHLGFSNWFNGALLKNSKKIRFIKVGGGLVFYQGNTPKTTVDFLKFLMRKIKKIDIEDFISYIFHTYGITFARDKLTWIIRKSNMYYDATMEKVYLTKEEYYEDF